jgi:orotate phosphoribosyltransferase
MELLIKKMIESGSLKFGEFTLSSGKRSNYYVDVKHASTQPEILEELADIICKKLKDFSYDKIACVELGGVPLAVSLSLKTKKPYVIFRKAKKDYGVQSDIVGELKEGERVVVVEDVTTTGSSAFSACERVRNRGGEVAAVVVVVDREEGASELFKQREINFLPILTSSHLLKHTKL